MNRFVLITLATALFRIVALGQGINLEFRNAAECPIQIERSSGDRNFGFHSLNIKNVTTNAATSVTFRVQATPTSKQHQHTTDSKPFDILLASGQSLDIQTNLARLSDAQRIAKQIGGDVTLTISVRTVTFRGVRPWTTATENH